MPKGAFFRDDLVQDVKADENNAYLIIPPAIDTVARENLRRDGSDTVVDARTLTAFFIDDDGVKHASNWAADRLEVTGTFTLNRRASLVDRIERTAGSFVTDGFTAGSFVSPEGSSGNDKPFKIAAVNVLSLEIDEAFSRISPDEAAQTLTLHQGWQRLEGLDFRDPLAKDATGRWDLATDAALIRAARQRFYGAVSVFVNDEVARVVAAQAPQYSIERSEKHQRASMADLRDDTAPTWADLQDDLNVQARKIFNQLSAANTGLSVTFNATAGRIERTAGSWVTDGYEVGMEVTPSGSASNDGPLTIDNVTTLNLSLVAEDTPTQEGPVTVDLAAVKTLTGYKKWRADPAVWDANKIDLGNFMSESIVIEWYDRVRLDEKAHNAQAEDATVWTASTAFALDDTVYDKFEDKFYLCNTAHTSQSERTDDVAKWDEIQPTAITLTAFPAAQLEL